MKCIADGCPDLAVLGEDSVLCEKHMTALRRASKEQLECLAELLRRLPIRYKVH
jgi:hypothetical protein